MKRILLFVLPILIIVAAAFTLFGVVQVKFEEEKLIDDLKRKARSVAESMDLSVRYVLSSGDMKGAVYLVEKFQARERLQGCVIYDRDGAVVAITTRFSEWEKKDKPYLQEIMTKGVSRGEIERFQGYTVYSYVLPVRDEENRLIGMVEVIHDTSYVFVRLTELWKRISVTLFAMVVMILLIATFLHRQIFVIPVQRLTDWFKRFQKGDIDSAHPIKEKSELGKLASEVEQVALSLRVARRSISDQAQERLKKEELWTETKLRDLIHAKLGDNAFFVVSNREPFMHSVDDASGVVRCIRPASGVVTAIHPIMCASGGMWVAHGGGGSDRRFVNSHDKLGVPPEDIRYILKRVWLEKEEEDGYYYGFSNEGLWPLCHNTHTRPIFRQSDWFSYKKVNEKFAKSILEELPAKNPFIFIQDYHFTLLPKILKDKRPDATIALFWHIPWPTAESFSICPYQNEILEGMLGCDLIGFHVQNHCNNFLDTANRLLESRVDTEKFSVVRSGKETLVRSYPISIDPNFSSALGGRSSAKDIDNLIKEHDLAGKFVAICVDRIDYTKGIAERVLAIDRFFEKYPDYRGKVVFIQIGAPSRTHIKRYHDLIAEIDELVEKKNWKYSSGGWTPILYLKRHFSPEEIIPFYKLADMCIVSSLHDGMNLVAKEYIGSKEDDSGCLLLSQFTGAARELTDAVIINPYAIEDFADRIKEAIELPAEEKRSRMRAMRGIVSENNVYKWAAGIVTELCGLKKG